MNAMFKDNHFNFFIPVEFDKGGTEAQGEDRYNNMIVQGVASTDDLDLDQQRMNPNGFDLSVFKACGLINYEHLAKKSPKAFIGEPITAEVKDNKFLVKGKLWSKSPLARDLYDTVEVMKASGSTRKLAWSIEGAPLTKDPHDPQRVPNALITHIALTFMPKNGKTYADFVKGSCVTDQLDYDIPADVPYLYKGTFGNTEFTLNKDFTITKKAMSAGAETGQALVGKLTSGAALKGESLDDDLKILTIPIETTNWMADNWESFKKDTKRAVQKALHALIEKAGHMGVYKDNEENRKLGRVGQRYNSEGKVVEGKIGVDLSKLTDQQLIDRYNVDYKTMPDDVRQRLERELTRREAKGWKHFNTEKKFTDFWDYAGFKSAVGNPHSSDEKKMKELWEDFKNFKLGKTDDESERFEIWMSQRKDLD